MPGKDGKMLEDVHRCQYYPILQIDIDFDFFCLNIYIYMKRRSPFSSQTHKFGDKKKAWPSPKTRDAATSHPGGLQV